MDFPLNSLNSVTMAWADCERYPPKIAAFSYSSAASALAPAPAGASIDRVISSAVEPLWTSGATAEPAFPSSGPGDWPARADVATSDGAVAPTVHVTMPGTGGQAEPADGSTLRMDFGELAHAREEARQATAAGLRARPAHMLLRVKWPMLKAPLLSAFAVGFAVSVMQFVPAQLAAAGRFSTLPMEAVTLSAGGNRALVATYGLALTLLPFIVFVLAGWLSRPRWKN